jgi:CubicO group peptidase (beta-lactamase class C family)
MMTRRGKLSALIGLWATGACASGVNGHPELVGRWGGFLDIGPSGLRVVLVIEADKPLKIISLDQGNQEFLATGGHCRANQIDARFGAINARVKLTRNASNGALEGEFQQGLTSPLTLTRLADGQMPERPKPQPFADFASEVTASRSRTNAPALGGAFALVKDGEVLTREAVSGTLTVDNTAPVTEGQKWHIGSITKSMTATLVARLVERGKLSWTMTMTEAFGALAPDMRAGYRDVTLAQLMSGRSGMPTNISVPDMFGHVATEQSARERRQIWVRQAFGLEAEKEVGKGFVYPNNGYVLAGALCEQVMDKAYEDLMREEVFVPLGMASAGFGPPPVGNPQGHRKALLGDKLVSVGVDEGADNPAAMGPAGRAHMSLVDLAKFGLIHAQGHNGLRNEYLRQETWQFLHTPPVRTTPSDNYAFGWVARPDGTFWHNGSNTYWLAELAFDPRAQKAACACANVASAEPGLKRVLAAGLAQTA